MAVFETPERKNSKLRIALQGMPFTGKTYTALEIATGLVGEGGKIALVDCEGGESELYAEEFDFKRIVMQPPYTPEKFVEYIQAAKEEGYDAVILDTISHEWAGEGGILEDHDELEKNSKSKLATYSAWGDLTPRHNKFIGAMLRAGIHVIATIRSKQSYAIDNVNGVNKVTKVALGPVQRDNIVYEFSIYLEMDDSHAATVRKDRTRVIGDMGTVFAPNRETGKALRKWIDGDDSIETVPVIKKAEPPKKANLYNKQQVESMRATYKENGWNESIFEIANLKDGTYDADKINVDYRQRDDLRKKQEETKVKAKLPKKEEEPEMKDTDEGEYKCSICGTTITKSQAETSKLFSNKMVCRDCQRKV